ncbi:MAG: nickel pincer cofactor biosynthesis protein LarC [Spirochaetia bacterium]
MKILVYNPFAGISGDMNLGAMVDVGVPAEYISGELEKLGLEEFTLSFSRGIKKGISGTRASVEVRHHYKHSHPPHRNLRNIEEIITGSRLSPGVKNTAMKIFRLVAEAEAKVHGKPVDEVHFHEVGAVDSIVDIVGAAVCFDYLKPDRVISTSVELGSGCVECAHGTIPVPAPATAEILTGVPVRTGTVSGEAATPTGAAILKGLVDRFSEASAYTPLRTGYGIGYRDAELPNVLRVFLAETAEEEIVGQGDGEEQEGKEACLIIECTVDDMVPEYYEPVLDSLFRAGVKDAWLNPVIMKRSRPAVVISVLTGPESEDSVRRILLTETTTAGIREYPVMQTRLGRRTVTRTTAYGELEVKQFSYRGKKIKEKPEFRNVTALAEAAGVTPLEILHSIGGPAAIGGRNDTGETS